MSHLSGETLLAFAKSGNTNELSTFLDLNPDLVKSTTDDEGNTALHFAASGGHVECVEALLQAGAEIEARNNEGSSPLCVSCSLPDGGVTAQALLDHGADVNSSPANEQMPISEACRHARLDIVRLLIANGSSPEATHFSIVGGRGKRCPMHHLPALYPWQPIHFAVRSGSVECIDELLKAGARINLPGKHDESALVEAITHRQFECARFLLKHGADIEHLNSKCESPLGKALMDPESGLFVSMLYQYGANMHLRRRDGIEGTRVPHHPLWDWMYSGSSPEPLRALVMADTASSVGSDRWKFWRSRAVFIILSGKSIAQLIQFINICNACGHLLDMTAKYTDEVVSRMFPTPQNRTLVEQSFRSYMYKFDNQTGDAKKDLEVMTILLAAGAPATEQCGDGQTMSPLQWASQKKMTLAMKVMIEGHVWKKKEKKATGVQLGSGMLGFPNHVSFLVFFLLFFAVAVLGSLQAWCRHVIRCSLGRRRLPCIRQLPLSPSMKDYLLFNYPLFRIDF